MRLNPSVKEKYPELAIGYALARNVKVEKVKKGLEDEKKVVTKEIQVKYGSTSILEIPDVKAYRDFYKMLGVDPTKVRPPIEYLLRKALSGSFLSINTLVDSGLLASVKHSAIVSVYDLDKTKGDLTVDLAKGGESLQLIDGRTVTPARGEVSARACFVMEKKYSLLMPLEMLKQPWSPYRQKMCSLSLGMRLELAENRLKHH